MRAIRPRSNPHPKIFGACGRAARGPGGALGRVRNVNDELPWDGTDYRSTMIDKCRFHDARDAAERCCSVAHQTRRHEGKQTRAGVSTEATVPGDADLMLRPRQSSQGLASRLICGHRLQLLLCPDAKTVCRLPRRNEVERLTQPVYQQPIIIGDICCASAALGSRVAVSVAVKFLVDLDLCECQHGARIMPYDKSCQA